MRGDDNGAGAVGTDGVGDGVERGGERLVDRDAARGRQCVGAGELLGGRVERPSSIGVADDDDARAVADVRSSTHGVGVVPGDVEQRRT